MRKLPRKRRLSLSRRAVTSAAAAITTRWYALSQRGLVTDKDIDLALYYTLWTRFRLGLFDPADKVPYSKYTTRDNDTPQNREVALELARWCC
jgi:hypothetical protein